MSLQVNRPQSLSQPGTIGTNLIRNSGRQLPISQFRRHFGLGPRRKKVKNLSPQNRPTFCRFQWPPGIWSPKGCCRGSFVRGGKIQIEGAALNDIVFASFPFVSRRVSVRRRFGPATIDAKLREKTGHLLEKCPVHRASGLFLHPRGNKRRGRGRGWGSIGQNGCSGE